MPYAEPEPEPAPSLRQVDVADVTGSIRPARRDLAYVACHGGRWRRVRVIAWGRSGNHWAVMIRWRAVDLGWYLYDPRLMHPAEHESLGSQGDSDTSADLTWRNPVIMYAD